MKPMQLLAKLRAAGVKVWLEQEQIHYQAEQRDPQIDNWLQQLASCKPELRALLGRNSALPAQVVLTAVADTQRVPASFEQKRFLFLYELEGASSTYNLSSSFRLHGELQASALCQAINGIINSHQILRTRFERSGSVWIQLPDERTFKLAVTDLEELPRRSRTAVIQQLQQADADQPFDLVNGPHLRIRLIRINAHEHVLVVVMHHIISDGHSIRLFVSSLRDRYLNQQQHQTDNAAVSVLQYRDYAAWQQTYLATNGVTRELDYWRRQLIGAPQVLDLDIARQRPQRQRFSGGVYMFRIPAVEWQALTSLSKNHGLTAFHCLLGAYALTLSHYSGSNDVVIGSPASSRQHIDAEQLIGPFLNMLAMRLKLNPDDQAMDYLQQLKLQVIDAMDNAIAPFEKVVEAVAPQRSAAYTPLFQHMFVLEDVPLGIIQLPGLEINTELVNQPSAKYDTTLVIQSDQRGHFGTIRYNTDLFDEPGIVQLAESFQHILQQMTARPKTAICRIQAQPVSQRKHLLERFKGRIAAEQGNCCLHQLVEQQVAITPQQIAVQFEDRQWTYQQLDQHANQLAWWLLETGVKQGSVVAISMDNGMQLVSALLAVGKCGAAYLPIGADDPAARVSLCLQQADAEWVLHGAERYVASDPAYTVLEMPAQQLLDGFSEQRPDLDIDPGNLVSILYTSGSTGTPKAVMTEHRALVNNLQWMQRNWPLDQHDSLLFKSPLTFDVSAKEIIWPLMVGGRLVISRKGGRHDPSYLWQVIRDAAVTVAHLVPTMLEYFIAESQRDESLNLRLVMCGGEALSLDLLERFHSAFPAELLHLYGPTEAAIAITGCLLPRASGQSVIPLGLSTDNSAVYVLNQQLEQVPTGVVGELFIGGTAVARGYYGQVAQTAEMFLPDPFANDSVGRMYATGDLVRILQNGDLVYVGRRDNQVKLYGQRIELGEIESTLKQHPAIRDCVLIATQGPAGKPALKAFLRTMPGVKTAQSELTGFLRERLSTHMLPSRFTFVDLFPKLSNGKIDRRQLAKLAGQPVVRQAAAQPVMQRSLRLTEQRLQAIWCELLEREQVGINENFFEAGGHSLLAIELRNRIRETFAVDLEVADIFAYATIEAQARSLLPDAGMGSEQDSLGLTSSDAETSSNNQAVAVIGMAGRFPGADNLDDFWANIESGTDSVTHFTASDLLAAGCPLELIRHPDFVPARAVIDDIEVFDAGFFGYTPMEASLLDPQHRLLLESAQLAFDDAGYSSRSLARQGRSVGVYVGVSNSSYYQHNLQPRHDLLRKLGGLQLALSTAKSYAATQLAFRLDLHGPAVSIDTACSTSLVAIAKACQSLQLGENEMALAGGASIDVPVAGGHVWQEAGVGAKDGHCRPFDASGSGTVKGMGGGVVLLKLLSAAERDGDHIHAVILGSAVNNDGSDKVGFTAPSVSGQRAVIKKALHTAGVSADSIGLIETHGTGTQLGDPIEIKSLTSIYPEADAVLAAVKGNIGHLDAAAGVAGFIKTVLTLTHQQHPPIANFKSFNQELDLGNSGLRVVDAAQHWPAGDTPRRAAVSSFGIGGTNAHVILEQAPITNATEADGHSELFLFSARTHAALQDWIKSFIHRLTAPDVPALSEISYTLCCGRQHWEYRQAIMAGDHAELLAQCNRLLEGAEVQPARERPTVAFMFPGQGTANERVVQALYGTDASFTEALDAALEILAELSPFDFAAHLQQVIGTTGKAHGINDVAAVQPWQFAVSMALASSLKTLGIRPDMCLGHSLGEYAAACVAGVFSLQDGLAILVRRGQLVNECESGVMLAVAADAAQVTPLLNEGVELAICNSPEQCVVAGSQQAIEQFRETLNGHKLGCRLLPAVRAFHSLIMAPIVNRFRESLTDFSFQAPQIPLFSNVTGELMPDGWIPDADYWSRHLQAPVRFDECLAHLSASAPDIVVELGAGATLCAFANANPAFPEHALALPILMNIRQTSGAAVYLQSLAAIWRHGLPVDWQRLFENLDKNQQYGYRRASLPGYQFQRSRHWIDASQPVPTAGAGSMLAAGSYQQLGWVRSAAPLTVQEPSVELLVVHDASDQAKFWLAMLKAQNPQLKSLLMSYPVSVADGNAEQQQAGRQDLQLDARLNRVLEQIDRPVRVLVIQAQLISAWQPAERLSLAELIGLQEVIGAVAAGQTVTGITLAVTGLGDVVGDEHLAADDRALICLAADIDNISDAGERRQHCIDMPQEPSAGDIQALLAGLTGGHSGLAAIRHGNYWYPQWLPRQITERKWRRVIPAGHACLVFSNGHSIGQVLQAHLQQRGAESLHHYLFDQAVDSGLSDWPTAIDGESATLFFVLDQNLFRAADTLLQQQQLLQIVEQVLQLSGQGIQTQMLVLLPQSDDNQLDGLTLCLQAMLKQATKPVRYLLVKSELWVSDSDSEALLGEAFELASELMLTQADSVISISASTVAARLHGRRLAEQQQAVADQQSTRKPSMQHQMSTLETALMSHWIDLLGITTIGIEDNFFALGGDSLMASQSISHIQAEFGVRIAAATFQTHASISELCRVIESTRELRNAEQAPVSSDNSLRDRWEL